MSGRAYSLCLLICLVVGLGLTAVIADAHARRDQAASTAAGAAFDAGLRQALVQANQDLVTSRATVLQLQQQITERAKQDIQEASNRQRQLFDEDQALAPAFERLLLTLCATESLSSSVAAKQ